MNNDESPWLMLLVGVLIILPSLAMLSGDSEGRFFRGVFIPTWNEWPLLVCGLILCGLSIYWMIVRRRAKSKPDDKKEDIPQEVLDFHNEKDADAKQNEVGHSQAGLEHTPSAGQTSSPQGEDKENPANKEETCMTENNKETENKKDT